MCRIMPNGCTDTRMESDVRLVYYEGRRHPYYSIQAGQRERTRERRWHSTSASRWRWGHFQAALEAALNGSDKQVA